jgi:hypothetical protein
MGEDSPTPTHTVWFAALALGAFLLPSNPLEFEPRFPTAPSPGS